MLKRFGNPRIQGSSDMIMIEMLWGKSLAAINPSGGTHIGQINRWMRNPNNDLYEMDME